jgi:fatty acid desaturase
MTPSERGRLIWNLADLIDSHVEELAQLETLDNGKPVGIARAADVPLSAELFRYMAGWATKIEGQTIPLSVPYTPGAQYLAYTRRERRGVGRGALAFPRPRSTSAILGGWYSSAPAHSLPSRFLPPKSASAAHLTKRNPMRATAAQISSARPSNLILLRQLRAELAARGLFAPSRFWAKKLLFWVPAFFVSYFALMVVPFGLWWLALAPLASMGMLTMGFLGHDAGHNAISRKRWVNDACGKFGMSFLCGMSFGAWRARHNLHHARCQEIEGDPDMHFGVLFSVYPGSASWHSRLGRFFLRIQEYSFWPLSSLYWVTLRYDGFRDLFQRPDETRADRFLLPLHWIVLLVAPAIIFGWKPALLAYVVTACLSSMMTASVFIPNHIGMPRLEPGARLSHLEQQVVTSRNVLNPRAFDFYYGGLNSQIEHHLFPRVSHHRYRAMRPIVRAFCARHGIAYREEGLFAALAAVSRHLGNITAEHRRSAVRLATR